MAILSPVYTESSSLTTVLLTWRFHQVIVLPPEKTPPFSILFLVCSWSIKMSLFLQISAFIRCNFLCGIFNAFELSFLTKDFPPNSLCNALRIRKQIQSKEQKMRLCCFYGYFAHVFCFFWSRSYESQQHTLRYFMLVCNLVGLFKYHSDLQITVSKNLISNVDDCHLIRLIIKCFILNF